MDNYKKMFEFFDAVQKVVTVTNECVHKEYDEKGTISEETLDTAFDIFGWFAKNKKGDIDSEVIDNMINLAARL